VAILSHTAEYALRALTYLARQPAGSPCDVGLLAARVKVPRNYLSKVLAQLVHEGLVSSSRGKGGGFALGRRPESISIYQIVAPFERFDEDPRCLLGQPVCSGRHACAAHQGWSLVNDDLTRFLRRTTLARLAAGRVRRPKGAKVARTRAAA
jgi:Rrf2 family protein